MENPESKKFVPKVPQNWEFCTIRVPKDKMSKVSALVRTFVGFTRDLPWGWEKEDVISFNRKEFTEAVQQKTGSRHIINGTLCLENILEQIFYLTQDSEVTFS